MLNKDVNDTSLLLTVYVGQLIPTDSGWKVNCCNFMRNYQEINGPYLCEQHSKCPSCSARVVEDLQRNMCHEVLTYSKEIRTCNRH